MSTTLRASTLVITVALLIPGALFALMIAYLSGNIPEGTRLVYDGFSFDCQMSVAHRLLIDKPQQAEIYIVVRDKPILASQMTKDDFAALGFERYNVDSMTNSQGSVFAMAGFGANRNLSFLSIPDHPPVTIPFASASGKTLTLPISTKRLRSEFGAPLKTEWIYVKPQWR